MSLPAVCAARVISLSLSYLQARSSLSRTCSAARHAGNTLQTLYRSVPGRSRAPCPAVPPITSPQRTVRAAASFPPCTRGLSSCKQRCLSVRLHKQQFTSQKLKADGFEITPSCPAEDSCEGPESIFSVDSRVLLGSDCVTSGGKLTWALKTRFFLPLSTDTALSLWSEMCVCTSSLSGRARCVHDDGQKVSAIPQPPAAPA